MVATISAVGFQELTRRDVSNIISTKEVDKAMFEYKYGFPLLTEFGKVHYRPFQCLPVLFAEIKAVKPTVQ